VSDWASDWYSLHQYKRSTLAAPLSRPSWPSPRKRVVRCLTRLHLYLLRVAEQREALDAPLNHPFFRSMDRRAFIPRSDPPVADVGV